MGCLSGSRCRCREISTVWLMSLKPWCAAISSAHDSTAGLSTSMVRPQLRAHQVVVVLVGAAAVHGLAVVGREHVDLGGVGERLQRSVDRREADG